MTLHQFAPILQVSTYFLANKSNYCLNSWTCLDLTGYQRSFSCVRLDASTSAAGRHIFEGRSHERNRKPRKRSSLAPMATFLFMKLALKGSHVNKLPLTTILSRIKRHRLSDSERFVYTIKKKCEFLS